MLVFQGSDWCAPCMLLERDVFSNAAFQRLATERFVMVRVDFPKRNPLPPEQVAHNRALAERFNKRGYFPLVVVLDAKGQEVRGECGYEKLSPEAYFHKLERLPK